MGNKKMFIDQFAEFSSAIIRALPREMDTEIAQGWIANQEALAKVLREALVPNATDSVQVTNNVFAISVNYARTLVEMIKAGNYNRVGDFHPEQIEKLLQRPNAGVASTVGGPYRAQDVQVSSPVEVILVHLNMVVKTSEVLVYMDSLGLRPARLEELLAFGEKYPDIQREFPIVALGTIFGWTARDRHAFSLDGGSVQRSLEKPCCGYADLFHENHRFLAVKK